MAVWSRVMHIIFTSAVSLLTTVYCNFTPKPLLLPYMGNFWQGNFLESHMDKKLLERKNLGNMPKSINISNTILSYL